MNTQYTPPKYLLDGFNCPECGAYAKQTWQNVFITIEELDNIGAQSPAVICYEENRTGLMAAICAKCYGISYWISPDNMIYPFGGNTQLPSADMPANVKQDYEEARDIMSLSPRGAAALLRLAIQKLCKYLGGDGENLNSDIALLVKNGLPVKLQQALDAVRVIGNNAVHPGQIDLTDDAETVHKLFAFINIICDNQITQPKQIDEFYQVKVPTNLKEAIVKRDKK